MEWSANSDSKQDWSFTKDCGQLAAQTQWTDQRLPWPQTQEKWDPQNPYQLKLQCNPGEQQQMIGAWCTNTNWTAQPCEPVMWSSWSSKETAPNQENTVAMSLSVLPHVNTNYPNQNSNVSAHNNQNGSIQNTHASAGGAVHHGGYQVMGCHTDAMAAGGNRESWEWPDQSGMMNNPEWQMQNWTENTIRWPSISSRADAIEPADDWTDEEVENWYLNKITIGCMEQGNFPESWKRFLELREKWLIFQARFRERNISFSKFNKKYQQAFRILRDHVDVLCAEIPIVPLPSRKWMLKQPDIPSNPINTIRVLTFNILSDFLNEQFSFQFVILDDNAEQKRGDFLKWNRRKLRIAEEIRRWGADIVLLQEVDLRYFEELVAATGLTKTGPITRRNTSSQDGICMLYKPSEKIQLMTAPRCFQLTGGGAAMVTTFKMADGEPLDVVNCHVQGMAPALDLVRAKELAGAVKAPRRVISGDFNGCLPEAEVVWESLNSAYDHPEAMASGQKEVITCHNDVYHSCGELDLILTSGQVKGFAQIQDEERLTPERLHAHPSRSLPNSEWPSDHVSLIADIDFTEVTRVEEPAAL